MGESEISVMSSVVSEEASSVSTRQTEEDAGDDTTENEVYYTSAPDGRIRQSTPSSADGATPFGTATPPVVTTTTKVTRKPLQWRPLVCSYKLSMKIGYPFPPDGLCDYLFHTFGVLPEGLNYKEDYHVLDEDKALLDQFKKAAAKSKLTSFGIDIYDHYDNMTGLALSTNEGKDLLRGLWDSKIVHYAILDFIIYSAGEEFAHNIVKLAKILIGLGDEYESLHESESSFFFLGVAPFALAFQGELDYSMDPLNYVLSNLVPDAVLYRSTRTDYEKFEHYDCVFASPSMWSRLGEGNSQMSFEGALLLRRLSTWPSSVVQMMSFSPAMAYIEDDLEFKYAETCAEYGLKPASFKCDPQNLARTAPWKTSPDGMDVFRLGSEGEENQTFVGYDSPESMKRKMCNLTVEHNFTGGWTMLHMEFSVVDGKGCGDLKYTGNYQTVQLLRDLMKLNFTSGDCT
ncbi:uncharacterized protein LOC135378947 isoform X2 [Ornithodoros turicata]|uniref:uncharacterized protein LOC135378947 isoform X2 n=1 Tax=Ornithodoros turicata TaxID=34597 RepID=UPI003138BD03